MNVRNFLALLVVIVALHILGGHKSEETSADASSIIVGDNGQRLSTNILDLTATNDATDLDDAIRPSGGVEVASSAYADDWPYPPFESGVIQCKTKTFGQSGGYHLDRPAVTITLGGREYGLNGAALSAGYGDPRPLMPTDGYGIFRGRIPTVVDEFLQIGMARCG